MAKIDSAYTYFLATYGKDMGNRYESHKRSELKSTYNSIVKANKESPLYKIAQTVDVAKFAIDIKESANSIQNKVSNLSTSSDDIASMLEKKQASSSDDEVVLAKYVGADGEEAPSFKMQVHKLAKPQVNRGNFLSPKGKNFEQGTYSFDLDTNSNSYEFQFNVNMGDTNLDVQQKISRLINGAGIGLSAEVVFDEKQNTALEISSKATGLAEDEEFLFDISTKASWAEINTLGIMEPTQQASNSSFSLNGVERSSLSNTFTVNKSYEVTLEDASDKEITIGIKPNTEAIADGINQLLDSYNGMVAVGNKYAREHSNNKLLNEIVGVAKNMAPSLEKVGISADEDGMLSLDRESLSDSLIEEKRDESFATLNRFKTAVKKTADKVSINPMNYVDKVIVEYKNPGKTMAFPYAPSAYAGMLVDKVL